MTIFIQERATQKMKEVDKTKRDPYGGLNGVTTDTTVSWHSFVVFVLTPIFFFAFLNTTYRLAVLARAKVLKGSIHTS